MSSYLLKNSKFYSPVAVAEVWSDVGDADDPIASTDVEDIPLAVVSSPLVLD